MFIHSECLAGHMFGIVEHSSMSTTLFYYLSSLYIDYFVSLVWCTFITSFNVYAFGIFRANHWIFALCVRLYILHQYHGKFVSFCILCRELHNCVKVHNPFHKHTSIRLFEFHISYELYHIHGYCFHIHLYR